MAHFDGLQAIAGAELPLTSALYLTRLPDYIFGRTVWLNLPELLRYIWLKSPSVTLTNVLVRGEQDASLPALPRLSIPRLTFYPLTLAEGERCLKSGLSQCDESLPAAGSLSLHIIVALGRAACRPPLFLSLSLRPRTRPAPARRLI